MADASKLSIPDGLPSVESLATAFAEQPGWEARMRLLNRLAARLPPYPEAFRDEVHQVPGCESRVWLLHRASPGRHQFWLDSESRVVRGLLVVMLAAVQGKPSSTLVTFDAVAWFESLGLFRQLSPSRGNGLRSVARRIQALVAGED